jgi:large repetitive protein
MTIRPRFGWLAAMILILSMGAVAGLSSSSGAAAPPGNPPIPHSSSLPKVKSVIPALGPVRGNTVVTITGTNLAGATSVTFGGYSASIISTSATQVVVIDPSGSPDYQVDVVVTLPGGSTSHTGKRDHFTYRDGPAGFPSTITGTMTDNDTLGNDGDVPPAETTTNSTFTLAYDASCNDGYLYDNDSACYWVTSASGTGVQVCYPSGEGSLAFVPFSFGTDQVSDGARIQVDAAGHYHLYFDFFAASAADGPVTCPPEHWVQNSVINLDHNPDGTDVASSDTYSLGQSTETVSATDNGEDEEYGNGITAPGWSGSATFNFTYGSLANPVVVSGTPGGGTVGAKYSDSTIGVNGGTSPYKVTATGLPPGLKIAKSGAISGTPTTAGTYTPTIKATDASKPALSGTETPTIVIAKGSPVVTLSASPKSPRPSATVLTLTAKITGTASATADIGAVAFTSSGHPVSCTTTKLAKNEAVCTTTAGALGAVGTHSLGASVAADANYATASSAPINYQVT